MKFILAALFLSSLVAASPCHHTKPCADDNNFQAPSGDSAPEHGAFSCSTDGNHILQYDRDHWVGHACPAEHKCVPDLFACVPLERYDDVYAQAHDNDNVLSSSSNELVSAPEGACTNGAMECYEGHFIQCNIDHWVIWHCHIPGTRCVPNDFECVPVGEEWDRVYEAFNPSTC